MFKKLLVLFSGSAAGAVMQLVRVIVVARVISVEDFGIAATFMVVVMVTQLMSNLGMQKLIIQAVDGDDVAFQSGLQGFQMLRGVVSAVIVFAVAGPMARFLGNDDLIWAYQCMALVPLMNACTHFDIQRQQRKMRYAPVLVVNLVPQFLALLLIAPLAWAFGDYRVMLFTVIGAAVMRMIASHIMAERPFRVSFDVGVMRRSLQFGWPMLLNGVFLALVIQGEKLIVGRELGMATLAIFAMGTSMLQAPMANLSTVINKFMLPQLSAVQSDDARFQAMAMVAVQSSLFSGVCVALAVVWLGEPLVLLALGPDYEPVIHFLVFFTMVEVMRSSRMCTSLVSLARGKTGNGLVGNLPRVLSLPVSWYVLIQGADLIVVLFIALGAEMCGFAIGMWMMRRRAGVALWPMAANIASFVLFLAALLVHGPLDVAIGLFGMSQQTSTIVLLGTALLTAGLMWSLWRYLWKREMTTF